MIKVTKPDFFALGSVILHEFKLIKELAKDHVADDDKHWLINKF